MSQQPETLVTVNIINSTFSNKHNQEIFNNIDLQNSIDRISIEPNVSVSMDKDDNYFENSIEQFKINNIQENKSDNIDSENNLNNYNQEISNNFSQVSKSKVELTHSEIIMIKSKDCQESQETQETYDEQISSNQESQELQLQLQTEQQNNLTNNKPVRNLIKKQVSEYVQSPTQKEDQFISLEYLYQEIQKLRSNGKPRLEKFFKMLKQFDPINIKMIKSFQFFGIPDADEVKSIRSLSWKLVLGYLPNKRSDEYIKDFIKSDVDEFDENELKLWETVLRDTQRTKSDFNFFQQYNKFNDWNFYPFPFEKKRQNKWQTHQDAIQRLLYIYGRLNPIKYVQGMNELMATIYYNFAFEVNEDMLKNVECDTFFCFTIIMSFMYDGFMQDFDRSKYGINSKVKELNLLLKKIDYALWKELDEKQVQPEFYSLRWILLMLSYEFQIHDTSKIWDTLFAHPKPLQFLNYICVSILHSIRGYLIGNMDYCETIKLLQNLRDSSFINLTTILNSAYENYQTYEKKAEPISRFVIF